jgi:hypothetical protein
MIKVVVFCEDYAHEVILKAIIKKIAPQWVKVQIWSAKHGKGKVISKLTKYLNDIESDKINMPDAIVVAIDANCHGYNEKKKEIMRVIPAKLSSFPFAYAIPDPHIERWLLIDSHAFKQVFGSGCNAPDRKCEKDKYKSLLNQQVLNAGANTNLGGIEFAEQIFEFMDCKPATIMKSDESLARFIKELKVIIADLENK